MAIMSFERISQACVACVAWLACGWIFCGTATAQFPARAERNAAWHIESPECVWMAQPGRPATLVLDRTASGRLAVRIDSDATGLEVRSGPALASIPLTPDVQTQLQWQVGTTPALIVNGEALESLRGAWLAVSKDDSQHILLTLVGAKYGTISLTREQGDVGKVNAEAFPKLTLESRATGPELVAAVNAMTRSIERDCTPCGGKGTKSERRVVRVEERGGMKFPVKETFQVPCTACRGVRRQSDAPEVIFKRADLMLTRMANLNTEGPGSTDAMIKAHQAIVDYVIGREQAWRLLNKRGRSVVAQRKIDPGTPVMLRCRIWGTMSKLTGDETHRSIVAEVAGTDQLLVFMNPLTAEEGADGDLRLAGGLVAGVTQTSKGQSVVVIQNGFVIAPLVDGRYGWWYAAD
jgi:hypothetical protein